MENNTYSLTTNNKEIRIYSKRFLNSSLVGITLKIKIAYPIKFGVPHLFEHLLTNQIFNFENVITNGSTTSRNISITLLSEEKIMSEIIPNIAKKITNLNISTNQLNFEKNIIRQEIREYQINSVQKFGSMARNTTFNSSDLNYDEVLGKQQDLKNISIKDIKHFIECNLCSKNIRIFIAGNNIDKYCSIFKHLNISKIENITNSRSLSPNKNYNLNIKNKKIFLNHIDTNTKLARISYIRKLNDNNLNETTILAISIFFTELITGTLSLNKFLKKMIGEVYFVKIFPIYYNSKIYIQIITSCKHTKVSDTLSFIDYIIGQLNHITESNLSDAINNLKLQQDLLFDGVSKSIQSFANMEEAQENILKIENFNKQEIKKAYRKLINSVLIENNTSIVIEYL